LTESLYDKSSQTRSKTVLILEEVNRQISRREKSGAYSILSDSATIEHIMPQTLTEIWKTELGQNWEQIYRDYLNTLGNLTLVTSEWNSTLNNKSFLIKKSKLSEHGLLLNKEWFSRSISQWNEETIRERAEFLGGLVLEIWPAIGEPPKPKTSEAAKPTNLIILGQQITVSTWRDVASQTTETIIKLTDKFEEIAERMPAYLDKEKFPNANRQLSNGWFLNTNLSAASIKTFCRNLTASAGLEEGDWYVEEV
jgi:hypothetical protein